MSKRMNSGSATLRIAALPSGRRMKYVIVVLWLAVIAVGGALAGILQARPRSSIRSESSPPPAPAA